MTRVLGAGLTGSPVTGCQLGPQLGLLAGDAARGRSRGCPAPSQYGGWGRGRPCVRTVWEEVRGHSVAGRHFLCWWRRHELGPGSGSGDSSLAAR